MTSQVVDKIKGVIDFALVSKFDIHDMELNSYVPICINKGAVFVVSAQSSLPEESMTNISSIAGNNNIKVSNINEQNFSLLLNYVKSNLHIEGEDVSQDEEVEVIEDENNDVSDSDTNSDLVLKYDSDDDYIEQVGDGEEDSVSLNSVAPVNSSMHDDKYFSKKIGEVLIQMGLVTNEQIYNALLESKRAQLPLGTILVQQGVITLNELKIALTAQQGYEAVTTDQLKVPENVLSMLPEDFIKLNKVIPISYDDNVLVVAMVNPNDKKVINDIIFLTRLKPSILIITHYEFAMCMQNFFNEQKKATSKIIKKIEKQALAFEREETLFEQAQKELKDDSNIVVKFVNKIVSDGIDMKASDIHIEPRLEGYVVRYRKDGILREAFRLPAKTESSILTRLKVISKMNIAEHRRPQDGSFSITYKDRDYDFRINTLPVGEAEKMVIRILAPAVNMASSKAEMKIEGTTKEELELIKKMQTVPNGIILTTGPTGSGKTTTLYTLLKAINDEKINITTIEDPVEIKIDGINQSQINAKAGITFASCMRAILRQDPDVILVGEIRDIETLETAISAALTGHLVLSTLHTNSAAATITRMIDMGAKDYLVSSTLVGIIAQRLVRKLCPDCRTQYFPTREEAELVVSGDEKDIQRFLKTPIYKPSGCEKCNFEGYKGRMGVYEIMPITKEIKKLIAQAAHDIQIEEAAVGAGMSTLHQSCLRHIVEGNTTIEEFIRVLGPVKE
ncbi:Flp pilus assembly complex ATPase component TadA [bacterium]|nr:Flp pilus assembly complex ATPase component TadA [bacterium]